MKKEAAKKSVKKPVKKAVKFVNLAIYQDYYTDKIKCISVNNEDGSGTRVTNYKGSGRWDVVATWKVPVQELKDAIKRFEFTE